MLIDFQAHLARQLGFLLRSAAAYDSGLRDEAYRIATAIRVLLHQTNRSDSLLHHLRAESAPLLSTTESASTTTVFFDGLSQIARAHAASSSIRGTSPTTIQGCLELENVSL
jgi:hypothetical protein